MIKYSLGKSLVNLGKNKGKEVYRATPQTTGTISFKELCNELADGSTVDAADVKAVLSRLSTVISRLVTRGFAVECGELGNFRPSFSYESVPVTEDFDPTRHIKKMRIKFLPRREFARSIETAGFELVDFSDDTRKRYSKAGKNAPLSYALINKQRGGGKALGGSTGSTGSTGSGGAPTKPDSHEGDPGSGGIPGVGA